MTMSLADRNIAILAANGFDENQMTEIQRALIKAQATTKTIAPEQGVVNGWQGEGWGHYFPVDSQMCDTLGSDYDVLVLPGGERGVAKLKLSPHAKRIINHFVEAGKPIAAIGTGVELLVLSQAAAGYKVAAPESVQAVLAAADLERVDDECMIDRNILTSKGTDITEWVHQALELFGSSEVVRLAA